MLVHLDHFKGENARTNNYTIAIRNANISLSSQILHKKIRINCLCTKEIIIQTSAFSIELETMNLTVFFFYNADLAQKVLDMLTLIACQLNNFTIFGMLDDRSVTIVFLQSIISIYSSMRGVT